VVFSGYSGFLHQYNRPPRYNWNIVVFIPRHTKWPGIMWYPLLGLMCMCPSVRLSVPRWFPDDNLRMDQRILFNLCTVVKYQNIQIKFEFQFDRIIGWRVMFEKTENMRKHGRVLFHVQLDALFFCTGANKSLRFSLFSTPCRRCSLVVFLIRHLRFGSLFHVGHGPWASLFYYENNIGERV